MAAKGPTPDFDQVTLRWWGVDLDGNPTTGRLELTYNSPVPLLDDDPVHPTLIYPTQLVQVLSTTTIQVDNGQGTLVDKTVGYASFLVPATDDPDIQGSGGTYTLVERLDNNKGQTRTFVASKDATDGVIFLPRISSVVPVAGQAVSAVSVAEVNQIKAQLASLLAGGSSGGSGGSGGGTFTGSVSWLTQVSDKPSTYAPSAHQHPQTDVLGLTDALSAKAPVASPTFTGTVSGIGKAMVGLGNVDNTADVNKPVSTATAAAITAAINGLVNGAPSALDTLQELAAQLATDESASAALTTALGNRLRFDAAQTLTSGQKAQALANLGIVTGTLTTMAAGETYSIPYATAYAAASKSAALGGRTDLFVRVYGQVLTDPDVPWLATGDYSQIGA